MAGKMYPDDFKLEVVEYSVENNMEETARKFGVAGVTVAKWRKDAGETRLPPRTYKKYTKVTAKMKRLIRQDWKSGLTQGQITQKYDVTVGTVKRAIGKRKKERSDKGVPKAEKIEVQTLEYEESEEEFTFTKSELKKFLKINEALKDG